MLSLHIEELILHGFAPGDRYRIADALERELARLLAEHSAPPAWSGNAHVEAMDAGAFQVAAGSRPDVIGGQIAEAVWSALSASGSANGSVNSSANGGQSE